MNKQQTLKAVQLIAFDQNKNPYIPDKALQVLSRLQSNSIHVIAVAGKYRTGKSYLLNRVLLDRNDGFTVGHTINACTKGLWMWPELVQLEGKDCLIIDTEGLGSLEEGESTDLKIFMLALLFSSYLIYNSTGKIDQQALESFNLVIQLANVLQRQDRYDSQELVNTFPSFLWLLRDFSLQLIDEKGQKITTTQYLQLALRHQPKSTPAAERKNQIRRQLRTFFQHRDCYGLVRPTEQQRDLQNLSGLPESRLRPQFVTLVKGLKSQICREVRPKRVKGRALTIDGFVQLCKYYTKALVDGKLPTITSHWDNICLGETQRIFQKYQLEHIKALEEVQADESQCWQAHRSILKTGLEAISKSFLGKLEKQLFKQRFQRKLESQYHQMRAKLNSAKNKNLMLLLAELDEQPDADASIMQQYERLTEKMREISDKSTKDDGVYCQLFLYLSEHSHRLLEESERLNYEEKRNFLQKIQKMQIGIDDMKKEHSQMVGRLKAEVQRISSENRKLSAVNSREAKERELEYINQLFSLKKETKSAKEQFEQAKKQKQSFKEMVVELEKKREHEVHKRQQIQQKNHLLEIEIAKRDQTIREEGIRMRKLQRQTQIVKNRYDSHLTEIQQLTQQIHSLHNTINQLEKSAHLSSQSSDVDGELLEMKKSMRNLQEENKKIERLLQDQKVTYETILTAPQFKHSLSLKRSLELQTQQNYLLRRKNQQLSTAISNCQLFTCQLCRQSFAGKLLLQHSQICKLKQMSFDVSYSQNEKGLLVFEIEVTRDDELWVVQRDQEQVMTFLSQANLQEGINIFRESQGQPDQNKGEQRRAFLQELLTSLGSQPQCRQLLQDFTVHNKPSS